MNADHRSMEGTKAGVKGTGREVAVCRRVGVDEAVVIVDLPVTYFHIQKPR